MAQLCVRVERGVRDRRADEERGGGRARRSGMSGATPGRAPQRGMADAWFFYVRGIL